MLPDCMRILVTICILCLSTGPVLADVYRWADEKGRASYSDRYREGAVIVPLRGVDRTASSAATAAAPEGGDTVAGSYARFAFALPDADSTLAGTAGQVPVSLFLEPALQEGHQIEVIMNGATLPQRLKTTHFSLRDVQPGTHTLAANVVDAAGKPLISAAQVTFHLEKGAAE